MFVTVSHALTSVRRICVAISCYLKDLKFSFLALLTSKTNIRAIAYFARLNTYVGEEKERPSCSHSCLGMPWDGTSLEDCHRPEDHEFVSASIKPPSMK